MKLTIKEANNGFVIEHDEETNEGLIKQRSVIQEPDDEDAELLTMQMLLYQVKEYFGVYYNKHQKKNLIVRIKDDERESE